MILNGAEIGKLANEWVFSNDFSFERKKKRIEDFVYHNRKMKIDNNIKELESDIKKLESDLTNRKKEFVNYLIENLNEQ